MIGDSLKDWSASWASNYAIKPWGINAIDSLYIFKCIYDINKLAVVLVRPWNSLICKIRSWNNGMCWLSFCVGMNLWYDTSCLCGLCPESDSQLLISNITVLLDILLTIDTQQMRFYCSVLSWLCLRGLYYHISLAPTVGHQSFLFISTDSA